MIKEIFLYGTIGSDIDGNLIAQQIIELSENEEVEGIDVHINSYGGDVLQGISIYNACKTSKKKVRMFIDGIAASIATIIMMAGEEIIANDFALMMVHNPYFSGKVEMNEKEIEVVNLIKNQLVMIYEKRGIQNINELMDNETWMDAKKAKKLGFIDKILKVKDNVRYINKTEVEIYNLLLVNNNTKKNLTEMEIKNLVDLLKIENENEIENSIKNMIEKTVELEKTIENNTNIINEKLVEIETLKNELKSIKELEKEKEIENYINSKIEAGLISNEQKESFKNLSKIDFESVKNILESLKPLNTNPITNQVNPIVDASDRASWTIKDWDEKDPEGLQNIIDNDPAKFDALLEQAKSLGL